MTLLYASTYADSLGKLSAQEQKQVKITTVDLMLDPKGGGLSLERLVRAADDNVWSARVSRDLRIIMRRDGENVLLAYVGHHDDAYEWAERRKFVQHERTGAMQIVEVIETREEAPHYDWSQGAATPKQAVEAKPQPFWSLSDDQLLDAGVPRDWLKPVQEMAEDEIDRLFDHLPGEAAEALYDFATGGRLEDHILPKVHKGTNAFMHPDAQRRFRVVENVDELKAALDEPFEKWAVFLHPVQRKLVEKEVSGPARVSGSAGTGKTIVALHRAVHLARTNPSSRILLTTFSGELADALSAKLKVLTQSEPKLKKRIEVRPIDEAIDQLYVAEFGAPNKVSDSQIRTLIDEARQAGLGGDLTPQFLFEEWQELVDAWDVHTAEAYFAIPRVGRRTRLGPRQREAAWAIFDFVRQRLVDRGLVTASMIYARLTDHILGAERPSFDHIVVDEAQDLTVAQVKFLGAVGANRKDALFLAGDIGQRIFRLPFSWARLGLDIRGRSYSLKVNYRTTHQIRALADKLLPPSITDMDGIEEGRRGTVSVFDGPQPQVELFDAVEAEEQRVAQWLHKLLQSGTLAPEIGILVRSETQILRARNSLHKAGIELGGERGVQVRTMHNAKGLEFRSVIVMACDEDVLPDPIRLTAIGDVSELETAFDSERHLLYVACTRARDSLLVTGVSPGSEFLDDISEGASK